MAVDSIPKEISSESDVSMVLNTLMYVNDFPTSADKQSVDTLLREQAKLYNSNKLDAEQKAAYECVYQYVYGEKYDSSTSNFEFNSNNSHPEIAQLTYLNHSSNVRGNNDGAVGAAFYSTDSSGNVQDLYVAYRGTGDGRWYDNGDAFSKKYSPYQQDAAEYFDSVIEKLGIDENTNVYVTGHSKGGNQAQFVTLASKNAYLVDKCISMDGEGFSPEAIAYFKQLYGEEMYEEQLQKMYAVCGDNDYVNVLGIKVVPENHTVYVESPTDVYDLPNSHGLFNTETGTGNLFDFETGTFYQQTSKQRDLAIVAKSISENIMQLPPEQREDICRSLMTILEYSFNGTPGLNGEEATLEEYIGFARYGDEIFSEILYTWDGQKLINRSIYDALKKYAFQIENGEKIPVFVDIICNIGAFAIQLGVEPLLFTLHGFIKLVSNLADIADVLAPVIEFCANVAKSIGKFLKETFDKNYRAAKAYIGDNSILQFDTGELYGLAERLWAVNGRLQSLDYRLDGLYRTAKWTDLGKIIKVASADFKIGWSNRVNNCANCLNDTANRFEKAESEILNLLGE